MAKINDIRVLAEETASDVASSPWDWMAYLDTAAKLYRYPFADRRVNKNHEVSFELLG